MPSVEQIVPLPDFPTHEELIDAVQQLQRLVEQLQESNED